MSIKGAIFGAMKGASIGGYFGGWYGAAIGGVIGFVIGAFTGPGGIAGVLFPADSPALGAPPGLQALSYTSNKIGDPICDVLGTTKLTGTLLVYGGEHNVAVTQTTETSGGKGGGGGSSTTQVTGYQYYMSWAIGLCVGPTDELLSVFRNEDLVWSGNLLRPESGGQETIVIPDMGSMTFYFGTDDQAANAAVGALIDEVTFNTPYRGLCWAFFNDCYIGDYNRMPTMRFVLRKTPAKTFSPYHLLQELDYNPAHALWYILHDMVGLSETWLDEDDFEDVAATLAGEGRGVSICFSTQQSAMDYLESINGHIDGILRYGGDGKFHPKLIRDDAPEELPLIDESVVLDDPAFSRKSWIDTLNEVKVQYTEIAGDRSSAARGLFGGGLIAQAIDLIEYIQIAILSNGSDFGDLSLARHSPGGLASHTRGIFVGGTVHSVDPLNIMDYVTISTVGNAIDFGDLTITTMNAAGASSKTRGLIGAGYQGSNVIDYITIATLGNATDFGDMTVTVNGRAAVASPVRAVFGGGWISTNVLDYVTIATAGNASDFGDLTLGRGYLGAASNQTRGLFAGGQYGSYVSTDIIDYITIATAGNAANFGDLYMAETRFAAVASPTRIVFGGGNLYNGQLSITYDYVTIASLGNVTNFGYLFCVGPYGAGNKLLGACSNSHGGIS